MFLISLTTATCSGRERPGVRVINATNQGHDGNLLTYRAPSKPEGLRHDQRPTNVRSSRGIRNSAEKHINQKYRCAIHHRIAVCCYLLDTASGWILLDTGFDPEYATDPKLADLLSLGRGCPSDRKSGARAIFSAETTWRGCRRHKAHRHYPSTSRPRREHEVFQGCEDLHSATGIRARIFDGASNPIFSRLRCTGHQLADA